MANSEQSADRSPPSGQRTPPSPEPQVGDTPSIESSSAPAVSNTAFTRALEEGGYFIDIGRGIRLSGEELRKRDNLLEKPQVLPGLNLRHLVFNREENSARISAKLTVPHLPGTDLSIRINSQGQPRLQANVRSELPLFHNKSLALTLDEQRRLAGTLTIENSDLLPNRAPDGLSATGGGTFTLNNGKFSGSLAADLGYETLGSAHLDFRFSEDGRASGSGHFSANLDFADEVRGNLSVDEQANLSAAIQVSASELRTPIQGLSIAEGTVNLRLDNGDVSGGVENLKLVYAGLGEAMISADVRRAKLTGSGTFNVTLSELSDAQGVIRYRNGLLSGNLTISSRDFPRALQVRSGTIQIELLESGELDFNGKADINLGPAGEGELRASKENGVVTIGTTIMLENIPGLQQGTVDLAFTSEGTIEGSGELAIDESLIPGLSGSVRVEYKDNLWSGESEIGFNRDTPPIEGTITVGIRQTEEGTLVFHGSGNINAEVVPGVAGEVGVVIDEEGLVTLNIAFTQTEPHELFPERRVENEFLNIQRNIPLWAILVAVIRVRAGVRAGVGPGQLRNTRVEGTWELSTPEPQDLSVRTEFFMPAFVEGYVAFGAGLGLDVLLGSLTGGIEGVATAGLYGAISVVPALNYDNGEWSFDGTATLAAGARLKLSLNAWAQVDALFVTVWEQTWELTSVTMSIGPDLALSANINMNLSRPSAPEIDFNSSEVDTDSLIQQAMPKDGPPSASAREAIENRAEWRGATQAEGPGTDQVPADLSQRAGAAEQPPSPGPRPPRREAPAQAAPGAGAQPGSPTGLATEGGNVEARDPSARQGAVPESEAPLTDQPRYPRPVSLATLNEPPSPMPRTAAQEREDLNAALELVRLIESQVEDSEQLSTYFDPIRRRFNLTFVGYVTLGEDVKLKLAINPELIHQPDEKLKGTGVAGRTTEITFRRGRVSDGPISDTVGIEMRAELGPDHPQGGPPQASALNLVMSKLHTDATGRTNDNTAVKGHLLNDNLGGPGTVDNLFPITRSANQQHEAQIESRVKHWVNDKRYWVFYSVQVQSINASLSSTNLDQNKVNSTFFCEAYVMSSNDDIKYNPITATIVSTFNAPATSTVTGIAREDEAAEIVGIRPEDRAVTPLLSSRVSLRTHVLDARIYNAIASARQRGRAGSWENISERLASAPGIGPELTSTLILIYGLYNRSMIDRREDIGDRLSDNQRGNLTRINGLVDQIVAALGQQ